MHHDVETGEELNVELTAVVLTKQSVGEVEDIFRREAHPVGERAIISLLNLCANELYASTMHWCDIQSDSCSIRQLIHVEEGIMEAQSSLNIPSPIVIEQVGSLLIIDVILQTKMSRQRQFCLKLQRLLYSCSCREPSTLCKAILYL